MEARIDELGPRDKVDEKNARTLYKKRLAELGKVKFGRIEIAPFKVRRFGLDFGLILRKPVDQDDDDTPCAEMQPGNFMAFFDPWDSGDYDT